MEYVSIRDKENIAFELREKEGKTFVEIGRQINHCAAYSRKLYLRAKRRRSSQKSELNDLGVCKKCGSRSVVVRWHLLSDSMKGRPCCSKDGCYTKNTKEHLHYICSCGFDWTGPTKDQDGEE